ncbi:MAG: S66 peptidase family protein [Candidatus Paceibacterota bacterium]
MYNINKLKLGDKVAILSPSFAAPAVFPHVHELGVKRLKEEFGLEAVEFPATKKLNASGEERAKDLIDAFEAEDIKGVIASIGGDDQVTYIKNLPSEPFVKNPKPFFGFSDNSHFSNFLWLNNIPSYYGGCLFTQIATPGGIDDLTRKYLNAAFFESGEVELDEAEKFSEEDLDWNDPENLKEKLKFEKNEGWLWSGEEDAQGISWCGCVESIDDMLRHGTPIPSLSQFEDIVLVTETTEEMPDDEYVRRFFRALGERGILERVKGVLVGRAKAWTLDRKLEMPERDSFREKQREVIEKTVRHYNKKAPLVQNLDLGHTHPQIPFPCGKNVRIDPKNRKISVEF